MLRLHRSTIETWLLLISIPHSTTALSNRSRLALSTSMAKPSTSTKLSTRNLTRARLTCRRSGSEERTFSTSRSWQTSTSTVQVVTSRMAEGRTNLRPMIAWRNLQRQKGRPNSHPPTMNYMRSRRQSFPRQGATALRDLKGPPNQRQNESICESLSPKSS